MGFMVTVRDVGERGLIELMMRVLTPMPSAPIPFWDDVSGWGLGDGRVAVLKTDMLVWRTDVPRGMTPFQAARKAVVMNFSDLASKGVKPLAFMASLGIPSNMEVEAVLEMARGFDSGSREYGAYMVGGDTNEAGEVVIGGVAFGLADEKTIMRRDGARPGDILATTGSFGRTAAAFKVLIDGYEAPKGVMDSILESVYMPKARVSEGLALAETGAVSASMDSSDGLALSLYDLSRSSHVGFRIDRLPASPEAREFGEACGIELEELVFYGGEEYELVFTLKPELVDSARNALRRVNCEMIEFGEVIEEIKITYTHNGEEKPIKPLGWNHFRTMD
ncbi:thiamine-phosphate kinase [Candidatus Bathyarchaeota archaeon]|nr:thiamine-phosphate kinase [Candidatus Bathyarchaeota archaeon]